MGGVQSREKRSRFSPLVRAGRRRRLGGFSRRCGPIYRHARGNCQKHQRNKVKPSRTHCRHCFSGSRPRLNALFGRHEDRGQPNEHRRKLVGRLKAHAGAISVAPYLQKEPVAIAITRKSLKLIVHYRSSKDVATPSAGSGRQQARRPRRCGEPPRVRRPASLRPA